MGVIFFLLLLAAVAFVALAVASGFASLVTLVGAFLAPVEPPAG